jgi:MFS family permease
MATASPVSTIVAADGLGASWSAVPNTAGIVGTGIGAVVLTWAVNQWGRRASLMLGYAAATVGAGLAIQAVAAADVVALSLGMLLLGLGNAAALLSRYAAADLYPPQRRGFAISTVVWAGTIGAVGGPLLLMPSSDAARRLGWAALTGPFVLAVLACGVAVAVAAGGRARGVRSSQSRVPLRELIQTPAARSALAIMVTAQVVMVAVMTAAPLDMHLHGHGLGSVGVAMAAHTLGMFGLSPVTGWLLDRVGTRPVMLAGLVTLVIATGLAATTPDGQVLYRAVALFLLGYGWNLCFVGGSARLARDLPTADRARVEGAVDAAVWGVAATASLASTMILAAVGYHVLAGLAGLLVVIPAMLTISHK